MALATEHELAALTVNPWLVKAREAPGSGRSRVTLGTVIGFPHGAQLLSVKAFEASKALEQGATQIDFVLNGGALASGDDETVFNDMLAVVDMAHSALAAAGVIVEADPLSDELVRGPAAWPSAPAPTTSSPAAAPARSPPWLARGSCATASARASASRPAGRFRTADQLLEAMHAGATRVSAQLTQPSARLAATGPGAVAGAAS